MFQTDQWRTRLIQRTPKRAACPDVPEESDLVPGLYEGGLKVWEASLDLVEHLLSNSSSSPVGLDGGSGEDGSVGSGTGRPKSVLEVCIWYHFPLSSKERSCCDWFYLARRGLLRLPSASTFDKRRLFVEGREEEYVRATCSSLALLWRVPRPHMVCTLYWRDGPLRHRRAE